jgi:hypothetical protein
MTHHTQEEVKNRINGAIKKGSSSRVLHEEFDNEKDAPVTLGPSSFGSAISTADDVLSRLPSI